MKHINTPTAPPILREHLRRGDRKNVRAIRARGWGGVLGSALFKQSKADALHELAAAVDTCIRPV